MGTPLLSATGIEKSFRHFLLKPAMLQDRVLRWRRHRQSWIQKVLDGVNIDIGRGECIGLEGPNGSGKTTLLRILAGLLPSDRGIVSCAGRMSCFFELGVGFHPERTAAENIYLHGLLQGMTPKEIRSRTQEIIDFAGVRSHADVPIKSYSTGMRQRLAFAASMHVEADLYLIDEVIAVGDREFHLRCYDRICALRENGKAFMFVSHSLQTVSTLCDRVFTLRNGRMVNWELPTDAGHSSQPSPRVHTLLQPTVVNSV